MAKKGIPKFEPAYIDPPQSPSLLLDPQEQDRHIEREVRRSTSERFAIEMPRLLSLFDHYEIEKADWMLLALMLARDFIQDFEPKGPVQRGRQKSADSFAVVLEIDMLAKEEGLSIAAACRMLSEKDHRPWNDRDFRSIQADYYARKKRLTRLPAGKAIYALWQKILEKSQDHACSVHLEIASLMADVPKTGQR